MNLKCGRYALAEDSEWIRLRRWYSPEQILGVQRFEGILRELAAALGGVDGLACELLELFHSHHDGSAIPVCGQKVTRVICGDMDTVAPVPLAGGEKAVELSDSLANKSHLQCFRMILRDVYGKQKGVPLADACIAGRNQL